MGTEESGETEGQPQFLLMQQLIQPDKQQPMKLCMAETRTQAELAKMPFSVFTVAQEQEETNLPHRPSEQRVCTSP